MTYIPATCWMAISLVFCKTKTVLSSITVISSFTIYLFAIKFCLYRINPSPMFLTFSRRFSSPNLSPHFLKFWRSSNDLSVYARSHFYDHLLAATKVFLHARIILDNHPAVKLFHDLETTAYYIVKSLSSWMSQFIIQCILRWADNLIRNSHLKVRPIYCGLIFLTQLTTSVWLSLFPTLI